MNLKKKLISAVTVAAILVTGIMPQFTVNAAADFETAKQAVNNMTVGWNLGNTLDSCGDWIDLYSDGSNDEFETAWGNPVTTKEMITAVKKAGFNSIRLPVTWYQHIDDKGNVDAEWMDRVNEIVDYVISQDLYCILNVHHDGGADGWIEASEANYEANSAKFAGLWNSIAKRFEKYDDKLLFECVNEVLDEKDNWGVPSQDSFDAYNKYLQLFVDTVRGTGGNNKTRNLVVMTYAGSHDEAMLKNIVIPTDSTKNHIILEIHNYDPVGFTWTEASWTTIRDTWGTNADKKEVDDSMAMLNKYAEKYGVPAIIGEYGLAYKNNDSERAEFVKYFTGKAAEYGIKCFNWDVGEMALVDRNTCSVSHPEVVNALMSVFGIQPDEKLPAPTIKGTKSGNSVTLTWSEVEGAYAYRVYQYNAESGKYVRLVTTKKLTKKITGLESGTYRFKVVAVSKTDNGYKNGYSSKTIKAVIK